MALAVGAHWLLLLFGRRYSDNATDVLIVLATSAIPLAAFNWLLTVLRLIGRLQPIVIGNVVFAVLTCGLAWILAPHGLVVLSLSWPVGLTAAAVTVAVPVWRWARRSKELELRGTPGSPTATARRAGLVCRAVSGAHQRTADP